MKKQNKKIFTKTRGELLCTQLSNFKHLENKRIGIRSKAGSKEVMYKFVVLEGSDMAYVNVLTSKFDGYLLVKNKTQFVYCLTELFVSLPTSNSKCYLLIPTNATIDDYQISYSQSKQVSKEQVEYDERHNVRKLTINETDFYLSISGNTDNFKRIIFSFPSITLKPATFKTYEISRYIDPETDLVIAISDRFGVTGSYMLRDDYNNSIVESVKLLIKNMLDTYNAADKEVIFFGISKGGFIANYYAQFFDIDKLSITCPQMSLESYVVHAGERGYPHSVNFLYFFGKEDLSEYQFEKFNAKWSQYIYSPLDVFSDCGVGSKRVATENVLAMKKHTEIAFNTRYLSVPQSDNQAINNQKIDARKVSLIGHELGKNLFIEFENSPFNNKTKYDCFLEVKYPEGIDTVRIDLFATPKGDLVSTSLEILVPEFDRVIGFNKLIICYPDNRIIVAIDKVSVSSIELETIDLIETIKDDGRVIKLLGNELSPDIKYKQIVCRNRFFNNIKDDNQNQLFISSKDYEPIKDDELGVLMTINGKDIYIPIKNLKHTLEV